MNVSFFIAMQPPTITAQEHDVAVVNGKPRFYDPPELKAARAKIRDHLAGHIPPYPFTGAVRLVTKWCFPVIEGKRNGQYKTSRPDTDNLQKMLKDVMTELHFWKDDAQVASEIAEKFWADIPGIYMSISELPQG